MGAPQVHCASCGRLVSARRVSAFRGGGLHPYPHTKGDWKRGSTGQLTIKPERCDGHTKPGQRPARKGSP
jgi:hypothetical protein